eukprot:SAG11_NODE_18895_length_479_cov_0.526316_2_plen_39_part_01
MDLVPDTSYVRDFIDLNIRTIGTACEFAIRRSTNAAIRI